MPSLPRPYVARKEDDLIYKALIIGHNRPEERRFAVAQYVLQELYGVLAPVPASLGPEARRRMGHILYALLILLGEATAEAHEDWAKAELGALWAWMKTAGPGDEHVFNRGALRLRPRASV